MCDCVWRDIESAPKDGRKIMLFYRNANGLARAVMARWLTDEQAEETDHDEVGLEAGWYECIDNWDDYSQVAIHEGEPTHWMPLPAAPDIGEGEGGMTDRDQIIAWAREAGLLPDSSHPAPETRYLRARQDAAQRFASLVAAHEREQCARVCDAEAANWVQNSDGQVSLNGVAAAIRGRADAHL